MLGRREAPGRAGLGIRNQIRWISGACHKERWPRSAHVPQWHFSARFPSVARAVSKLPDDTVIDGEIVALDETGRPSFNVLQNYNHSATLLQLYAFDLVHLAGKNLRDRPLNERRELLRAEVMPRMPDEIRLSETFDAPAAEIVAAVKKQGLEGVIAKRRDSLYEPDRRSGAWVKMRINKGQELVIGGYVPAPKNFDSLIVGYYERDDLIYDLRHSKFVALRDDKAVKGVKREQPVG
jgi:ATP-dependent DNA ligase